MADQDEEEKRRALEEWQRQQVDLASKNAPTQNAIPPETPQYSTATRGVDYAQRGLGGQMGNTLVGDVDPNAPQTGFYINQAGENLGPTTEQGFHQPSPQGAVGIQGQISPQEAQFWQANPLGAVKDNVTGNLVGLGSSSESPQQAKDAQRFYQNMGATIDPWGRNPQRDAYYAQRRFYPGSTFPNSNQPARGEIPNFVNIPEVDPNISARRSQIAQSIADIDRRLPSAQTQRIIRGQPSERERLIMERAHYVRADDVLANELHNQNQARTHASDLNMKMRDQYAMTQDATALREDFNKIKSKPGTPQYAQDVLNLRINHPDAMRDPRSVELLDRAARAHEEEAAFLQRAQEQGVTPQVSGFHQGRTTYTIPKTSIPATVQTRYAKVQANIERHLEQSAADAKATNLPDQPYKGAADLHAFQNEKAALERQYPGLVAPTPTTTPAATPQPTAAPAQNQQVRVTSAADYNKVPSGTLYIDPNGVTRRKP